MVTFGNKTNSDSLDFPHTNNGNFVLVFVCHRPDEEISVDTFDFVESCSIENSVAISLFKKLTSDLSVQIITTSSGLEQKLINVCSLVDVTSGIFKKTNGVGKEVISIPLKSFSKAGGITIGCGSIDNLNAEAVKISSVQTVRWNYAGTKFRNQCISANLGINLDEIPIDNEISESSNYAIIIIGVE